VLLFVNFVPKRKHTLKALAGTFDYVRRSRPALHQLRADCLLLNVAQDFRLAADVAHELHA